MNDRQTIRVIEAQRSLVSQPPSKRSSPVKEPLIMTKRTSVHSVTISGRSRLVFTATDVMQHATMKTSDDGSLREVFMKPINHTIALLFLAFAFQPCCNAEETL